MAAQRHPWKFFRAGGVDQVVLSTAADLENLASLDQKLWVALACPAKGLEFDERTLEMLDSDHDGRIRPPEILEAIAWLKEALVDLGGLFDATDELSLSALKKESTVGKELHEGAHHILEGLGKADKKTIRLEDVSSTEAIFAATKLNGDGIVPADSAEDDETAAVIRDIIDVMGAVPDRSKKPGVDQPKVDAFFEQVASYAAWMAAGDAPELRPLGPTTSIATDALEAVRAKIDDYFARTRLVAFDARAKEALNATEAELQALGAKVLTANADDAASLPLAKIEAGRALPLRDGVNPAWARKLQTFASATLGGSPASLSDAEWVAIQDKLAPVFHWRASKPDVLAGKLGDARVAQLATGDARARVTALIAKDAALAPQFGQIESVEKVIRFRRDLVPLLQNFVNFAVFYGRRKAIFQAGTLYLDARSCDLCLAVEDVGRHALLAGKSQAYLVYCDCVHKKEPIKRSIVAAVTGGDVDNILVGRNGVFYDRSGADWDATVTKVVENPISLRQAFWLPYKRFVRAVEDTFAKRVKAADDEASKHLEAAGAHVGSMGGPPPLADKDKNPVPGPKPMDIGTVAAIGVAVGGIATFFSTTLATFMGLGMWMPIGVVALVLAISGPSMLIAWLKLRQRNIGPILDANGWAVNALAKVNVPFGGALTNLATIPPGASRTLVDPFAEEKSHWKGYLVLAVAAFLVILWGSGRLDGWLPAKARMGTLLHHADKGAGGETTTPSK